MSPSKRREGRAIRAAYSEAWRDREATGSDGESLLSGRLHEYGLDAVLTHSPALKEYIFKLWRQGVPPQNFDSAYYHEALRVGWSLMDSFRRVWGAFQKPEPYMETMREPRGGIDDDPPDGVRTVLDEVDRPVKSTLPYEAKGSSEEEVRHWLARERHAGLWHNLTVWLVMGTQPGTARVFSGDTEIGNTSLSLKDWEGMTAAAATEHLYADGLLKVRLRDGDVVYGYMEAWFPARHDQA